MPITQEQYDNLSFEVQSDVDYILESELKVDGVKTFSRKELRDYLLDQGGVPEYWKHMNGRNGTNDSIDESELDDVLAFLVADINLYEWDPENKKKNKKGKKKGRK